MIGISLNLYNALGSKVIWTMLILSIQEYGICFHFFMSFQFLLIISYSFQYKGPSHLCLGILIPNVLLAKLVCFFSITEMGCWVKISSAFSFYLLKWNIYSHVQILAYPWWTQIKENLLNQVIRSNFKETKIALYDIIWFLWVSPCNVCFQRWSANMLWKKC